MSIFNSLGGGNQQQATQITPQQAMSQLQADPVGVFRNLGINIPAGMNNPQQITQHLLQSGQLPQNAFTQAMQIFGQMGRR